MDHQFDESYPFVFIGHVCFHKALRTELDCSWTLRRCVWTHLTSRGWPSTWNRLYLKVRGPFTNTVLNQLTLSSTITQLTASENHVKLSSLKPRHIAWKKKWREVKRLSDARAHSGALCNHIHAEGAEELSPQVLANGRSRRTKLAEGCYSEWGYVPSGVPQGTKLGPTPVPYFDQWSKSYWKLQRLALEVCRWHDNVSSCR